MIKRLFLYVVLGVFFAFPAGVFASVTDGSITAGDQYAWGEKIGWVNFKVNGSNVIITDAAITGYAWSQNYGWINLAPATSGVKNNGEGDLSGYAWGENLGWIDFGNVSIDSSGYFHGYASSTATGRISLNCANTSSCSSSDFKVSTDWRPRSARPACNNTLDDDSDGKTDYPDDPGCGSLTDTDETNSSESYSGGGPRPGSVGLIGDFWPQPKIQPSPVISTAPNPKESEYSKESDDSLLGKLADFIKARLPAFLRPSSPELEHGIPGIKIVPLEPQLAFRNKWQLLPPKPIKEFALAPLPKEIDRLVAKFPNLEKTFEEVGIAKMEDVTRLRSVRMTLPDIKSTGEIPSEIVFAKTGARLIDLDIVLSMNTKGELLQKVFTISGKPLRLSVKPDGLVRSVVGYVVFKSRERQAAQNLQPVSGVFRLADMLASAIFAAPELSSPQETPLAIENKMVLMEFEYFDPDRDGIYTADIYAPVVDGEYEIITVMEFGDPGLGRKAIRLIAVVDPEGYVYKKVSGGKLRVEGAIVTIYKLDREKKEYEIWRARDYQQENPQITDDTGKYSFLVPEGEYYVEVSAPGYLPYESSAFSVEEGSGVHFNVELKTKYWWARFLDAKTVMLCLMIILLLYNFYRDKIREAGQNNNIKNNIINKVKDL